jgi:hypothetical protein
MAGVWAGAWRCPFSFINEALDSVIKLDPDKHLPAVEPPAEGPENSEDQEA